MVKNLNSALDAVEITYEQVNQMAGDIVKDLFKPINNIIEKLSHNVEKMSVEMLRIYMLDLQVNAFQLSEIRDRAAAKAEISEAIRKEAYAASFISQEGTVNVKESNATLEISDSIVVECLYELSSSLIKTKLDQTLRMIDTLKSIMMSRMQEIKISNLTE